ncbi:MAG: hypothetical protein ABEJ93_00915 [Candidatus Nanohalobium sp.]
MVKFTSHGFSKADHLFVEEDPARIYRGLKDLLVDEFDVDRIEEGKMEFNVSKPKDRIRLHAFKEKSPHTVIHWNLSWKATPIKTMYEEENREGLLKAKVSVSSEVVTVFPGWNPAPWEPHGPSYYGQERMPVGPRAEEKSRWERSKLYEILVGLWYKIFYKKEVEKYGEEGEEVALRICDLMREKFGVEESIGRTGASHYTPPWQ